MTNGSAVNKNLQQRAAHQKCLPRIGSANTRSSRLRFNRQLHRIIEQPAAATAECAGIEGVPLVGPDVFTIPADLPRERTTLVRAESTPSIPSQHDFLPPASRDGQRQRQEGHHDFLPPASRDGQRQRQEASVQLPVDSLWNDFLSPPVSRNAHQRRQEGAVDLLPPASADVQRLRPGSKARSAFPVQADFCLLRDLDIPSAARGKERKERSFSSPNLEQWTTSSKPQTLLYPLKGTGAGGEECPNPDKPVQRQHREREEWPDPDKLVQRQHREREEWPDPDKLVQRQHREREEWPDPDKLVQRQHREREEWPDPVKRVQRPYQERRRKKSLPALLSSGAIKPGQTCSRFLDAAILHARPCLKIDGETEVPEDVFDAMLKAGEEARGRGQHFLKSNKLVNQDSNARLGNVSTLGNVSSRGSIECWS